MRRLSSTLVAGTATGFNALAALQLALHACGIQVDLTGGVDISGYADAVLSHAGPAAGLAAVAHAALAGLFAWGLHGIHAAEADRRRTGEWAAIIGVGLMAVEACALTGVGSGEIAVETTFAAMLLACLAVFLDRLLDVEDDPDDEAAFSEATVLGRGLAMHALMYPQLDDVMLREDRRS